MNARGVTIHVVGVFLQEEITYVRVRYMGNIESSFSVGYQLSEYRLVSADYLEFFEAL